MKMQIVVTGFLLSCLVAHSQTADSLSHAAEITIVPRIDCNPRFTTNKSSSKNEVTLGGSSLYSLFEGNITPDLSFSMSTHWLCDAPAWLYQYTLHSDSNNWLDWANLTYSFPKGFSLTLGKDMITLGGYEFDDYDFDVFPDFCSSLWNNLACYQWGGKLSYTTPKESTTITLQMTTSPYGERPFSSGKYNYSLGWSGEYGPVRTLWNATALQKGRGDYEFLFTLGQQVDIGDFTLGIDYFNKVGDEEMVLVKGTTLLGSLAYSPCEKVDLLIKGGYEHALGEDNWFCGASVCWFPLNKGRDLRAHLAAGYNSLLEQVSISVGAIYYFNIPLFKKK